MHHAVNKCTMFVANEKPVTESMTWYKKLWSEASTWSISKILPFSFPVFKILDGKVKHVQTHVLQRKFTCWL